VTLSADVNATSGNLVLTAGSIGQDAGTTLRAGGDIVMQAAGILLSGALIAGGNVTLAATSPIPGFPDSVGVLSLSGPVTAGGDATLSAITGAQLSAPLAAETLTLKSNLVLLEGAAFTLGKAGLISAPAGLLFGNQVTLRPRDATRLPTLILDGRSANALATLPGFVQPDSPGVAARLQPTQLAQFGAASPLPGSPLTLNLDAGQSAVFVLADGATISGSVTAGRLGILGTGGSSNLIGTLGGQTGAAAAALASASATADEAAQYSFNGTTIGTVVTPPPDIVPPVTVPPVVVPPVVVPPVVVTPVTVPPVVVTPVVVTPVTVPPVVVPPVTDVTPPAALTPPAAALTPPSVTPPSVQPGSPPGNAPLLLAEPAPPTPTPATDAIEAVAAALIGLPVNISVGVSATAASAGVSIAGPGVIGNGFTATAAALAQQPETIAELRATEPGAAAEQRNSFSRRFVPPASPVHTRPAQGRLSDPEVLLPDSGGNDY
jgi:hypothetical protein